MLSARLLRRELLASYHHYLLWILVSLLYGWGLAWVFVGFGCCVWFGISLWVGFLFSFWNGGGSLLFGGLVDDGFGFEKSCVLMKFLGFLGVGLWTVCVLFGCCVFPVYVNNSLWVWIQTWALFCLDAVCVWICWVSFKICITGWLEFVKCGLVWFGRGFWDWFDLGGCERRFVAMVVRYWGGGCGLN